TRPGSGTTVGVYLPASAEAGKPDTNPETETARSRISDPSSDIVSDFGLRDSGFPGTASGRPVVLVIDDEDAVRRVAQMMLQQLGFAVIPAANGEQAVELFARYVGTIRAVLLDLTMPRMGGAEVMAAVRRI